MNQPDQSFNLHCTIVECASEDDGDPKLNFKTQKGPKMIKSSKLSGKENVFQSKEE